MKKRYRVDQTSAGFRVYDMEVLNYVKKAAKFFLAKEANDADIFAAQLDKKRKFCKPCGKEVVYQDIGKDYSPFCSARCEIIANNKKK